MSSAKMGNAELARQLWPFVSDLALERLAEIVAEHDFSIARGELILLDAGWFVTHAGLLRVAKRHRCAGITVQPLEPFCDPKERTWAFEAKVFKSKSCRGFSGYGDAYPGNVPQHLWGNEMRIAETRAVNRALRKAYSIALCSVEELNTPRLFDPPAPKKPPVSVLPERPAQPTSQRERLISVIRRFNLDSEQVKAYALDQLGVSSLKDADRVLVARFITKLAEDARVAPDELRGRLNSYGQRKGA